MLRCAMLMTLHGVGGERVTRAYTVEVQTASVFYAQSLILLSLMAVKYGHTR